MSTLYDRIKEARENLKLSQEDLAKKLGYKSRSTIAKIESGENDITQSKIAAFAEALNVSPSYLMGWEDDIVSEESKGYYFNEETARLAQEVFENPELHMLFDASRKLSPDSIKAVLAIINKFKD